MAMDENFWLCCRLCAVFHNSTNHVNLLNYDDLLETIEKHFHLKISENDVLPTIICETCHKFIMDVSAFYKRMIVAQQTLHEVIGNTVEQFQDITNENENESDNDKEEASLQSKEEEYDIQLNISNKYIIVEQNEEVDIISQNSEISESNDNKHLNHSVIQNSTNDSINPRLFNKTLKEDLKENSCEIVVIRIDLRIQMNCLYCDKQLPYLFSYMEHNAIDHSSEALADIFQCPLCNTSHLTLSKLKLHLIMRHLPDIPIPIKCEMCKVELVSFLCYWEHINFEHLAHNLENNDIKNKSNPKGDNTFKCPLCNEMFSHYYKFKIHIGLTHTLWSKLEDDQYTMVVVDKVDPSVLKTCSNLSWVSQVIGKQKNNQNEQNLENDVIRTKQIERIEQRTREKKENKAQILRQYSVEKCNIVKCLATGPKRHINFEIDVNCKNCDERFDKLSAYMEHLVLFHQDVNSFEKWQCPFCSVQLYSNEVFNVHLLNYHIDDIQMELNCQKCKEKFPSINSYGEHISIDHSSQWICPICYGKLVDRSKLKIHIGLMHMEWLCEKSDADYSVDDMLIHLICMECSDTFENFIAYRYHMKSKHANIIQSMKWLCPICEEVATLNSYSLKSHFKSAHYSNIFGGVNGGINGGSEIKRLSISNDCQVNTPIYNKESEDNNKSIINKENGTNEANSSTNKSMSDSANADTTTVLIPSQEKGTHIKEVTGNKNDTTILCTKNSRVSADVVTEVIDFPLSLICQRCCKRMEYTSQYIEHMINDHENLKWEQKWLCPICNIKSRKKCRLKIHMLHNHIHDIPMKLPCNECNVEFNSFNLYLEHTYCEHKQNERDWKCPLCNRILKVMSELKAHLGVFHVIWLEQTIEMMFQNVTNIKSFTCCICNEQQKTFDEFCLHMRMKHLMAVLKPIESIENINSFDVQKALKNHRENDIKIKKSIKAGILRKLKEKMINMHDQKSQLNMQLICQYCQQTLQTFNQYRNHIKLYHINYANQHNWSCPICGLITNYSSHLLSHLWKHSARGDDDDNNCKIISKTNDSNSFEIDEKNDDEYSDDNQSNTSKNIQTFEEHSELMVQSDTDDVLLPAMQNSSNTSASVEESDMITEWNDDNQLNYNNVVEGEAVTLVSISFVCQICKETFQSSDLLQIHMKYHEDQTLKHNNDEIESIEDIQMHLSCMKCNFECATFLDYCSHMKIQHRDDISQSQWFCPICITRSFDKTRLKYHLLQHKELNKDIYVEFKCKECKEDFASFLPYSNHMELKHGLDEFDNMWSCPKCNARMTKLRFKRHYIKCHLPPEAKEIYKCPVCTATFWCENTLHNHIKKHKSEKEIERKRTACPYCGKYYLFRNLDIHIKMKHLNRKTRKQKAKKFICTECGKSVSSKYILDSHKEKHAGIASHECKVCKKRFTNIRLLKRHVETHDNRKHICLICGAQFNTTAYLNTHLWIHRNKKSNKCNKCGRAFQSASLLKNHSSKCSSRKRKALRNTDVNNLKEEGEVVIDDIEIIVPEEESKS